MRAFFILFFCFVTSHALTPSQQKLLILEKSMKYVLSEQPIYLKERQQLTDVFYDRKKTFSLVYSLDVDAKEIDIDNFRDLWIKEFGNKFCLRPAIQKVMSEDVRFAEHYYDNSDHYISTLVFGEQQCRLFIRTHERIATSLYYETLFEPTATY